jgi:SAM-dependent methyltransferase
MNSRVLPNFAEHPEDAKNHEIETPIVPAKHIRWYLDRCVERRRSSRETVRILDVGCGRGDTVAWLCAQGWDAYGVDVSATYIERGRRYLVGVGADPARLQLLNCDLGYPFDDSMFDVVVSDQVIEHVDNLDLFVSEVARVSASGACGLHIYPAKWYPIEPHLLTPFTHWLPKGQFRRTAEAACMGVGLAAHYFPEFSFRDRVEIFSRFSEEETFYRSMRRTVEIMERHGLDCDARQSSRDRVSLRIPNLPKPELSLLGWLCRHVYSVAIYTSKR